MSKWAGTAKSDDGLMDGFGARSMKFEKIGDTIEGTVVSVERKLVTDVATGAAKHWDNGDPVFQFVFTLEGTGRDDGPDDDGTRRVFAKNKMLSAIREAIKQAGLPRGASAVGGVLKVQHHAIEPAKTKGFSPTKLFRAKYTPPAVSADGGEWDDKPAAHAPKAQRPAPKAQRHATTTAALPANGAAPDEEIPF